MDTKDQTMEEKCENLMNIVVETRKRFGKMCVDYDQKTSFMENKILNLQLETISNYRVKPRNKPDIKVDGMSRDIDDFIDEVLERQKRLDNLRQRIKDTESVVLQLKKDSIGQKVHHHTVEKLLKLANEKNLQKNVDNEE